MPPPLPTLKRFERDDATASSLSKRIRDNDASDFLDSFAQNNGPLRILAGFLSLLDCKRFTLTHIDLGQMKCLHAPSYRRKVIHIDDHWIASPHDPVEHVVFHVPAVFQRRLQIDVPHDLESLTVTLSSKIPSLAINGARCKRRIKLLTLDWDRADISSFSFNELLEVDTLCVRGPGFYNGTVFDSIRARRIVVMNPTRYYAPHLLSVKTASQVIMISHHNKMIWPDTTQPVPNMLLDKVDTRTIQILRESAGPYKASMLILKPSESSQDPDDHRRPSEELEAVLDLHVFIWAKWFRGLSFQSLRTLAFSIPIIDAKFITESCFPSLTSLRGRIQGTLFIWEALDDVVVRVETTGDIAFLPSRTGRPYSMKHLGIHTEASSMATNLLADVSNVSMIYKLELRITVKCVLLALPPVRTLFLRQAEALPGGDWVLSVHNLICEHRLGVDLRKFSNLKYFELFRCGENALHESFFLRAMMNPPPSLHTLVLRSRQMQDRLIALPFQLRRVFLDNVNADYTWINESQVTELGATVFDGSACVYHLDPTISMIGWNRADIPPEDIPFFENYPSWELPYSAV